jgi:hypothetical protein
MFFVCSVSTALHPASGLAQGFAQIVDAMCRAIAVRAARDAARRALLVLLWQRLRRLAGRLERAAARAAAGTLRAPRPSTRPTPHQAAPRAPRPPEPLPSSLPALARLAPEVVGFRSQLRALLSQPAVADLLAATPRMARHVRPLCRMLGVDPPPPQPHPPRPPDVPPPVQPSAGPEPQAAAPTAAPQAAGSGLPGVPASARQKPHRCAVPACVLIIP